MKVGQNLRKKFHIVSKKEGKNERGRRGEERDKKKFIRKKLAFPAHLLLIEAPHGSSFSANFFKKFRISWSLFFRVVSATWSWRKGGKGKKGGFMSFWYL